MDELREKIIEDLRSLEEGKTDDVRQMKPLTTYKTTFKDIKCAKEMREEGNKLYMQNNQSLLHYHKILQHYNESIAYAPIRSEELATAYSNKAALLLHMQKYKECITESEKVQKLTESIPLRIKSLCRKAECLTALGSPENRSHLEQARSMLSKLEDSEEVRKTLNRLINKAQVVINKNKLNLPKEDEKKLQATTLVAELESKDRWEQVKVEYSKKYGRHFVAARDFEPGELILAEKPYRSQLDDSRSNQYCYHCFIYLWTVVPCDHCCWYMFCSEKCKTESSNQYHEGECAALMNMRLAFPSLTEYTIIPFIVSIFFKALKEAGGITELRSELKAIDESKDPYLKDVLSDENISSYKSVYTIPVRNLPDDDMEYCIRSTTIALIGLSKFTRLFGSECYFSNVEELIENDRAMFVGALLLQFNIKVTSICNTIQLVDPTIEDYTTESEMTVNYHPSFQTNCFLRSSTMLIINGCMPNTATCLSHGVKFVIFALQPIKAGTKLVMYHAISIYENAPKSKRQARHKQYYNCPCDCQACNENWFESSLEDPFTATSGNYFSTELNDELMSIRGDFETNFRKPNYPDIKIVSRAKDLLTKIWSQLDMPSPITIEAVLMLKTVVHGFLRPSEIFRVAGPKKESKYSRFLSFY